MSFFVLNLKYFGTDFIAQNLEKFHFIEGLLSFCKQRWVKHVGVCSKFWTLLLFRMFNFIVINDASQWTWWIIFRRFPLFHLGLVASKWREKRMYRQSFQLYFIHQSWFCLEENHYLKLSQNFILLFMASEIFSNTSTVPFFCVWKKLNFPFMSNLQKTASLIIKTNVPFCHPCIVELITCW